MPYLRLPRLIFCVMVLLPTWAFANMTTDAINYLPMPKISVQLWSVRDAIEDDFDGTLQQLAAMGFDGVEFAGKFGSYQKHPAKLKQRLAELGIQASGAHIAAEQLGPQQLEATVAFYQALGVKHLIIPWDERAWHPDGVVELVAELNQLSGVLTKLGMTIGFHNHDKEFASFQQQTYWDYIAQQTHQQVLLQLDVGWVTFAGHHPADYLKKYPGRTLTTHYKIRTHGDGKQSPILGENNYDWPALINSNRQFGGTQWIVLEQEEYPRGLTSLQALGLSKQGLDKAIATAKRQTDAATW